MSFGRRGGFVGGLRNIVFEIAIWMSLQIRCRPRRRKRNKHNDIRIKYIDGINMLNKIKVGNYTYGPLDCRIGGCEQSYIDIGCYCGIAEGVKFICGFGHNIKKFCHHPMIYYGTKQKYLKFDQNLKNKLLSIESDHDGAREKGPIIIDDDVWIGTSAIILSGVHIGQGAVIGAGAVVTKDIPPYAIAGGVPAKIIKYRFPESTIKELLKINYKNIPIELFWDIYEDTVNENFDAKELVNKINSLIKKGNYIGM